VPSLTWKKLRRSLGRFRLLPDRRWAKLLGLDQRKIRTVFDVGAFDGDTARIFRRVFPSATIHCFEPAPEEFGRLARWAAGQSRVTCEQSGLGNTEGTATLFVYPESPWVSSMRAGASHWNASGQSRGGSVPRAVTVPVRRLDDVAAEMPLDDGILAKIDVEGAEADVIRGGMKLLSRAEALVVEVTVEHRFDDTNDFLTIATLLDQTGLVYAGNLMQSPLPDGTVRYVDALFMRRQDPAR